MLSFLPLPPPLPLAARPFPTPLLLLRFFFDSTPLRCLGDKEIESCQRREREKNSSFLLPLCAVGLFDSTRDAPFINLQVTSSLFGKRAGLCEFGSMIDGSTPMSNRRSRLKKRNTISPPSPLPSNHHLPSLPFFHSNASLLSFSKWLILTKTTTASLARTTIRTPRIQPRKRPTISAHRLPSLLSLRPPSSSLSLPLLSFSLSSSR